MEEHVEPLPDGTPPEGNRGWFQPGDRRINREGRPRGSKAGPEAQADRAPCADRLKLLFIPERVLRAWLGHIKSPRVVNLPEGFEVVGCRLDSARGGVAFTIRSPTFPRIAQGAPIPEFAPEWNGLMWS